MPKKTCNYLTTLLLFQLVIQSCRFHGVCLRQSAPDIRFLFPFPFSLLPFGEWILHLSKNLKHITLRRVIIFRAKFPSCVCLKIDFTEFVAPCRKRTIFVVAFKFISKSLVKNWTICVCFDPACRRSETLWCVGNTVQRLALFFREILFIYENTIRIARPRACETILCGKAERNINTHALANHFGRKR